MIEDPEHRPVGLQALAERHGVGLEAVRHLLRALQAGQGNMAQFDHPDLGGFGQWSRGGMVMVGRMNDHALKARVDALCTELAAALPLSGFREEAASGNWWPDELGLPSSAGAQNTTRYAFFPEHRRLAIETDGRLTLYDTGERIVTGASQQQGGSSSLRFSGPQGSFSIEDLTPVEREAAVAPSAPTAGAASSASSAAMSGSSAFAAPPAAPEPPSPSPSPSPAASGTGSADILSVLERLAELHKKGVLTEAEFSAKKAELLARL
ncbi:SHOCT domain-containing protein [Methylorubrum populi]|uniref:SHOCT domain-containing protein n=1 Tax=Methylorubrum populi TaxID=223967 RepID=UPI0031F74AA1